MTNHRLNIIDVSNPNPNPDLNPKPTDPSNSNSNNETSTKSSNPRRARREEAKAKFERLWLLDPEQFNPMRNALQRERLNRTWTLMREYFSAANLIIADLGCGGGDLSAKLAEEGAHVDAIDIANNALKVLQTKNIQNITGSQDYVPNTMLKDEAYDVVISTEVIAFLHPDQYRLFTSELARIMRSKAFVVCSTEIDIHSDDALHRFADIAETEFEVEKWIFSYHALYIHLLNFMSAPSRFAKAWRDKEYRQKELKDRVSVQHWWFKVNSTAIPATLWRVVQYMMNPLLNYIRQSNRILIGLENVCRFIWSESGISHAIFIGKRRSLIEIPPETAMPIERKQRKQVWE